MTAPHSEGPGPSGNRRHRDRPATTDHEDGGRHRVAPRPERARLVGMPPPQHEQRAHGERREQQHREPRVFGELVLRVRQHEQRAPDRLREDGHPRRVESSGGCGRRPGRTRRRAPSRSTRAARPSSWRSGCRAARPRPAPRAAARRRARAAGPPPPSRSPTVRGADLADRHGVEVEHVQAQVHQHHGRRANRQGARHVAAGLADLLGDVGRGVPAAVREHHDDERERPVERRRRRAPR